MSKELFVSSTPHETKVAIVEEDQLAEIYFERENEYTLAGSIYKGKVTRVLPGMQSAFVEIGLERDAFLYVTDFVEPQEEDGEIETIPHGEEPQAREEPAAELPGESRSRGRRGRGDRGRRPQQPQHQQPAHEEASATPENGDSAPFVISNDFDESDSSELTEAISESGAEADGNSEEQAPQRTQRPSEGQDDGPRRWRGRRRRGGRRGRGERDERPAAPQASHQETPRAEAPRQEAPPQRSYQPIILPGESLSKYRRQQQQPEQQQHRQQQQQSSSEAAPPITEAFTPEELGHTAPRFDHQEGQSHRGSHESLVDPVGRVLLNAEEHEARMAASAGTAPYRHQQESSEQQPGRDERHQQRNEQHEEQNEQAFRSHAFGAGAMEEEQIEEEEEAETAGSFMQEMEEEGYEELEEETLDRTPAAAAHTEHAQPSQGDETADVTEAVRDSEVEETTGSYGAEGMEEDDSDSESDAEEHFEEPEEMVSAAGEESEGDNIGNQSDENNEGRAEVRGPSGYSPRVAPERARRGGRDNRRGGRGRFQKGGGAGGPRGRRNFRMPLPQIGDLLKEGQEILVQIAKEPIGKKGARITSHIALPGRYLVYMPTVNHNGVSRKISSEEERQRLKRIINSERENQTGGFIVRTAAEHVSEEDLRNDIRFLLNLWHEIKGRAESSKAPALIYHDLNLVERILRDQVSGSFSHIWVDTEAEYERVLRFVSRFQPTLVKRVKLYTKETPLFEQFNIQDEINKALKSKVWLKSGGYIVINQTEALVAIDINTGKYVGKTQRLEDTIVKTNVDAIKEIVRQIRLRDLGGIIVIDFIDMDERRNRQKVMQELELALKADRAPSKVLQFNDFGLVAITRKRVKQSLERTLGAPCTYCTGTGLIKSVTTVANEIYVEMRKMTKHLEGKDVIVRVNPEVAKALKANNARWLSDMEELTGRNIIVKSDVTLHQEQFDIH
ncbi:MAG: Rne/Rng family ribonuclease [Terriglobales bacterium]